MTNTEFHSPTQEEINRVIHEAQVMRALAMRQAMQDFGAAISASLRWLGSHLAHRKPA